MTLNPIALLYLPDWGLTYCALLLDINEDNQYMSYNVQQRETLRDITHHLI
jgi:hypothetical protein